MAAPRTTPSLRLPLRSCIVACVLSCVAPAIAAAACPPAERAQLAAAARALAGAPATAATADASGVLSAARRRCSTARFAYAVARTSRVASAPAAGQRARIAGVDLVAVTVAPGVVWRLDAARAATRLARTHTPAARLRQRAWTMPTTTGGSILWSSDPSRPRWDADLQSRVATTLARSRTAATRADAGASVRAFAPPARQRSLRSMPLLDHLALSARLAVAASGARDRAADRVARATASSAYRRVAATPDGGWSRLDGAWSSERQHRALLVRTRALLRRYPHAATARVTARLARQLAQPTDVRFRALPSGAFYPWPRDGAHDSQSVTVHVDKPGTLRIDIYAAAGDTPIRSIEQPAAPGDVVVAWDGASADGTIQEPGEYVYVVDALDIAGTRSRTPGLEPFRIARDATPPAVRGATVRYLTSGSIGPRLVVSWNVDEPTSPIVRTQLVLSRGAKRVTLLLDSAASTRVMRRPIRLGVGTWAAAYVFTDGSGNVTTHPAGQLVVR